MDSQTLPSVRRSPNAPLQRTGSPGNKPIGCPKEPKLDRPLKRQYQAAEVLAQKGFLVQNNPSIDRTTDVGIRSNADPDFRIQGIIFDCYTPDPPLRARDKARKEAFALSEPSSEFDFDWDENDQTQKWISEHVKAKVLDTIRTQVKGKVDEKQAFNIVLNLTDVRGTVTPAEVQKMLQDRGVDKLERVLVVSPTANAIPAQKCLYQEVFEVAVSEYEQYAVPNYANEDLDVLEFSLTQ